MKGWVYIISNSVMPGIIKIGYSAKDPRERAKELGTGAPLPYHVEYEILVEHPNRIERAAHQILSDVRAGKEWFKSDIPSAIQAIKAACGDKPIYLENRYEHAKNDDHEKLQSTDSVKNNSTPNIQKNLTPFPLVGDIPVPNKELSFEELQKLAKEGNADAQYRIGCCFDTGNGVRKNLAEGFQSFLSAAEKGHVLANVAVGRAYLNGRGVAKNKRKSIPFLRSAANSNNAEAQYYLGKLAYIKLLGKLSDNECEKISFEWTKLASDQGYAPAQCELAVMYTLKNQHEIALKLHQSAALQGLAIAQRYLADAYLDGAGCKRNLELAEFWYRQAVLNKDKIAKKRLEDWDHYCNEFYPDCDSDS